MLLCKIVLNQYANIFSSVFSSFTTSPLFIFSSNYIIFKLLLFIHTALKGRGGTAAALRKDRTQVHGRRGGRHATHRCRLHSTIALRLPRGSDGVPPLLASRLARTLNVSNEQGILNIDQLLCVEISRGARSGRRGERAPEDSLLTAGRAEPAPRARAFLTRRAASRRQTRRPPPIGGPTNCVTHDSRQEAPRYSTLIFCQIECRDQILVNYYIYSEYILNLIII